MFRGEDVNLVHKTEKNNDACYYFCVLKNLICEAVLRIMFDTAEYNNAPANRTKMGCLDVCSHKRLFSAAILGYFNHQKLANMAKSTNGPSLKSFN